MTKGFKEKLGEGDYGSVYKEKLYSGRFAVIKMLDKSKADGQDFINKVATLRRICHVNVVQLIGFCVEGSKHVLVYEFMDNGSLDKHIFLKEGGIPINNKMIFDISLGVEHGIEYVHEDFGLAKLHSIDHSIVSLIVARGALGYIAPEFFYKYIKGISYKADVYSFRMLLTEMVGCRKNVNVFTEHLSRIYLLSWIYDQHVEVKNDIEFGDETDHRRNMGKKMFITVLWYIQLNPINRPMHNVIEMLEGEIEHIKVSPKPFAPQETLTNDARLNTNSEIASSNAMK